MSKIDAKKAERVAFLLKEDRKNDLTKKDLDATIKVLEVLCAFHAVGDHYMYKALKDCLLKHVQEWEQRYEN